MGPLAYSSSDIMCCCPSNADKRPNPPRDWALTFKRTHALYNIAISNNITQFKTQSTLWGVKDAINTKFVIESRTNPALKTKMEVLDLNYPNRLYNPFLLLEGTSLAITMCVIYVP
jgi:hypothetical protein